jgi:hypothetical protein
MNDREKAEKLQLIIHDLWEWLAEKHKQTGLKESEYLDVIDKLRNDQSIIEDGFLAMWKRLKRKKKRRRARKRSPDKT